MMKRHPDRILCVMQSGPAVAKLADHIERQLSISVVRAPGHAEALELLKSGRRFDVLLSERSDIFRYIVDARIFTLFVLLAAAGSVENWLLDDSRFLGAVDASDVHKALTIIVMGFTIRRGMPWLNGRN